MKKSLFIAGLDFAINNETLKELFSVYGTVESAKVATDRETGRSRGFGFVDMSSPEEAQKCIDNLNNTTVSNRQIVVKFKEERSSGFNNQNRNTRSRW